MIGDASQYQDLVTLYGSYGDAELVALARGMADLTDAAQEALKEEMTRRKLDVAGSSKRAESREVSDEELLDMRAYAETAPDECIFDFENEEAVQAAYYALVREGIRAVVVSGDGVRNVRNDHRGPRLVVTPKDAQQAAAILSEPSTDALTAEADETVDGFALPHCPACGGEETLLESVDPVNQWRCDDCGHTWLEEGVSSTA